MKNFKFVGVCLMMLFLLNGFSCKNSESSTLKNDEVVLIKAIKMPIVGGPGVRGVRIILNIEKQDEVRLDSIVYNGRSGEISKVDKIGKGLWVESYFYDEKEMVEGKGWLEYKAEGNTCKLYYNVNGKTKSILVLSLEVKQDDTLWE